ncbi:MAG TPA: hypothetical protein VHM19_03175 [Polyangiales bacterium]|jgi:hypothetical protein|nr:hypothetical protein [Polyangiales bacterium]
MRSLKLALIPAFAPLVVLAPLFVTSACTSEDPAPVFVDASYQLRCIDCQQHVPDEAVRNVQQLDGEAGYKLECDVSKSGSKRQITIDVQYDDPDHPADKHSIKIAQALIDGKDPGGQCEVTVVEARTTYAGKCTADAPTATEPCQVSFKISGGSVKASVYCDNIPSPSSIDTTRYLVAPNTLNDPATIEVEGCSGL